MSLPAFGWYEGHNGHMLVPGQRPAAATIAHITKTYQQVGRESPLWDQMVAEFGPARAEELLFEFRYEVRG